MKSNRGNISDALARLFGIKGGFPGEVREEVGANVHVLDLSNSPYLRYGFPVVGRNSRTPAAGKFTHIIARPGAGVALQIDRILVRTASAIECRVAILTAAEIAALSGVPTVTQRVLDLASINGAGSKGSSDVINPTGDNANAGTEAFRVLPGANVDYITQFHTPGCILFGNDENGVPGLAIMTTAADINLAAAFFCREWPLPQ